MKSPLHASSNRAANSLPLSVWISVMSNGATARSFERKSAAEADEWFVYAPAKANVRFTSIAVYMYRLIPSTKRTMVSTSMPRFTFLLILGRFLTQRGTSRPVRAWRESRVWSGRSPRFLRSRRQRPVYDSETPVGIGNQKRAEYFRRFF